MMNPSFFINTSYNLERAGGKTEWINDRKDLFPQITACNVKLLLLEQEIYLMYKKQYLLIYYSFISFIQYVFILGKR